jgi:oxalate decarboxylase/phosphoglucose isomerase-like protein (cupin superfamily)
MPETGPVIYSQEQVEDSLRRIDPQALERGLDEKHQADPIAGIAIVNLEGSILTPDGEYHLHGARVFTSSTEHPNYVNPHLHKIGVEPYVVFAGDGGEMNLGWVVDGQVVWDDPKRVKPGDTIRVKEGQVHSLRNTGDAPLDFVFACPDNHLVDHSEEKPEGDRYLTKDLPNGIPPQYPK